MLVSVNQPAYLPWPGYFDRIAASDVHVVLDHVQFEKNSLVNRNRIRTATGTAWLTVPIKTKGLFGDLAINKVEVVEQTSWRRKHLRALKTSYGRAPYFESHVGFFEALLTSESPPNHLTDYLSPFRSHVTNMVGIDTRVISSTSLAAEARKSELVLELCRRTGATEYLSGPLGRDYLDKEAFQKAGIKVRFHNYSPAVYQQHQGQFIPGLSFVDMMMNVDPTELSKLIEAGRQISDD